MAQMMLDDLVTYIKHRKLRFAGCTMGLPQLAQLVKIPPDLLQMEIVDDPVVWPIAAYLKMSATELIDAAEAFAAQRALDEEPVPTPPEEPAPAAPSEPTEPEPAPAPARLAAADRFDKSESEAEIEISVDDVDESDDGEDEEEGPARTDV